MSIFVQSFAAVVAIMTALLFWLFANWPQGSGRQHKILKLFSHVCECIGIYVNTTFKG